MKASCSHVRKFLIFQQADHPRPPPPPSPNFFLIFLEMELCYISLNGNPKELLIFQEVIFPA